MNQRIVLGVAAVLMLSGCGSSSSYKNNPRPPSPITITASVSERGVEVSPAKFGAGPITLVVTNQTQRLRDVVLESANEPGSNRTGLSAQHTGPINPQGTGSLKADLRQGSYTVRVQNGGIRPAKIVVGRPRASAQNQLLQP